MRMQNQNIPAPIAYRAITSGEKTYWWGIGAACGGFFGMLKRERVFCCMPVGDQFGRGVLWIRGMVLALGLCVLPGWLAGKRAGSTTICCLYVHGT